MTEPSQESLTEAVRLLSEGGHIGYSISGHDTQVLATALDEHKAKMREVSDAVKAYEPELKSHLPLSAWPVFQAFIIPDHVDPLVEALESAGYAVFPDDIERFRAALAKRNARIVFDDHEITTKSVVDHETPKMRDKPDAAEVFRAVKKAYHARHLMNGPQCEAAAIAVIAEAMEK